MQRKRTDKATVIAIIAGVALYFWSLLGVLWNLLPAILGSRGFGWAPTVCWLLYLSVLLVLGTLWRRRSWLIAVGIGGALGVLTLLYLWLNGPLGVLLMLVFLSPYSASGSLLWVVPVAVLPWLLLGLTVYLDRRKNK